MYYTYSYLGEVRYLQPASALPPRHAALVQSREALEAAKGQIQETQTPKEESLRLKPDIFTISQEGKQHMGKQKLHVAHQPQKGSKHQTLRFT